MVESAIVGVDLGGTKVTAGRVTNGVVGKRFSREISAGDREEVVLAEVIGAIEEVIDDSVVAIGCGVPSIVEVKTGVVLDVENIPSWRRVPLKDQLEQRFAVTATVNNDANAFVVGEHVFGSGRGLRNLVGLTLGTGLGAGVIIDGRLCCGSSCGVGEIGRIPYKSSTVEAHCSGQLFREQYGEAGEVMYERAIAGDAPARASFDHFGRELANAVMIAVYAYDPEAIILGGSISSAFDLFTESLQAELGSPANRAMTKGLVVERSRLGDAAVLGAAALCFSDGNPGEK
jgi:glucokinase